MNTRPILHSIVLAALLSILPCAAAFSADLVVRPDLVLDPMVLNPDTLVLTPVGPTISAADEERCPQYLEIAAKFVPEGIGDPRYIARLISVPDGTDWMERFPTDCMKEALNDSTMERMETSEELVGGCLGETSVLRYNKASGEFKYINRSRVFDLDKSSQRAVDEFEGIQSLVPFLLRINLPFEEANAATYDSVVLMGAGGPITERTEVLKPDDIQTFQAERHYRFRRAIGGVPVLGSKFFAAVANDAEVAKLRVHWPRFVLDPKLREGKVLTLNREAVITQVYRELLARNSQCEPLESIHAYVAYVPFDEDLVPDNEQSADQEKGVHLETVRYEPKLVVSILPRSQFESGEEFTVDILGIPGGEEMDDAGGSGG